MRGIGDRLSQRTKVKFMQERANKYNVEFEKMEATGLDSEDIQKKLSQTDYEKRHPGDEKLVTPYQQNQKLVNLGGILDFGFEQSHKVLTSAKQMYKPIEELTKTKVEMQKKGVKNGGEDLIQKQKEVDKKIKEKIQQDHIAEMYAGADYKKDSGKSQYQENYEFNKAFQGECDGQDFTHHMLKNDLKWYAEAYVKFASTIRK